MPNSGTSFTSHSNHGAGLPSLATCATLTRMAKKSPPKSAMKPAPKANNPPPAKPAPKKGGRKR